MTCLWFKHYHGAATDPKWLAIADVTRSSPAVVWGAWSAALEFASEHEDRGSVVGLDPQVIASFFRVPLAEVARVFDLFRAKGLIVADRIAKWVNRQERDDEEEISQNTLRTRRWRAKRAEVGLPFSGWEAKRIKIFERDEYTCQYCGNNDGPFHCDHILPRSRGGTDEEENLATACAFCNCSKGDKTVEEWRASGLAPAGVS